MLWQAASLADFDENRLNEQIETNKPEIQIE